MDKFIKIIKYILLITLLVFIGLFIYKYYLEYPMKKTNITITAEVIGMFISLIILFIINILDLLSKNNKVRNVNRYNLLTVISLVPIDLIFFRMLFDNTLLSNVKPTQYITKEFLLQNGYLFIDNNSIVIIIIVTLLLIYRCINLKKSTK